MLGLAIVFALSGAAGTNGVSSVVAEELIVKCAQGPNDPGSRNFCNGYALGVFDRLVVEGKICTPDPKRLTIKALEVARSYLAAHTERGSEDGNTVLADAFKRAFPC